MKPSEKQILVIEKVKAQVNFWKTTNDIQSPTHFSDNDQVFDSLVLFDEISELDATKLKDQLNELLTVIRGIR
jgi:hypothetical protein